jgi:hypothetical protein
MTRICGLAALALMLPGLVLAQVSTPAGDFVYHARPQDTLIGIARRLLIEPRRWPEIQARNNIADPRHIPLGHEIRIPYAWLRLGADIATVTAVSGDVREGGRIVVLGQTFPEGSRIETGTDGSVTLALADGSVITVQKLSVLTLEEMRQVTGTGAAHDTRFKLESGRLQTRVKPHGDVGRFEIFTPVAVSAVRGTEFRAAFEPGAANATTETLEGSVAVSASGADVTIPADFGTRVAPNQAPLPPVRLLPAPDLQGLPGVNNANRLKLEWPAVQNAIRYRLQLSPDAEFHSFLADVELDAPNDDLPAPADGSYWLRVRAIDGLGLEGHDTVRSFVQHQLPGAPKPVRPLEGTNFIGTRAGFAWSRPGPETHYQLQIAADVQFTQLFLERDIEGISEVDIENVPPGRYFWRVRATDDRSESGDWSAVHEFIQRQASPTPFPPTLAPHAMQFHWDPQDGMRYHVQIARTPEFAAPVVDQTVDTPTLSTRRLHLGTYYARVQTIAEDGTAAPFGEPVKFEAPVPLWLKILVPAVTAATVLAIVI